MTHLPTPLDEQCQAKLTQSFTPFPYLMPSKPRNRVGEVYGKLTVVRASERRTKSGNAYWWCRCSCGNDREVPGDKLSHNAARKKPIVTACLDCSREFQVEGVCAKNDREERQRRNDAQECRSLLKGVVPDGWLKLPLTDSHARELGQVLFFRGRYCLRGHLAPYRINGGCLTCSGQKPSAVNPAPLASFEVARDE